MHNQSDPVAPGLLSVFTPVGEDVFHIAPLRRTTIPGHRTEIIISAPSQPTESAEEPDEMEQILNSTT